MQRRQRYRSSNGLQSCIMNAEAGGVFQFRAKTEHALRLCDHKLASLTLWIFSIDDNISDRPSSIKNKYQDLSFWQVS